MQVNSMLREQLEQANVANAALSEDIRKLTADWARARDELEQREAEWRREEEVWGHPGHGQGSNGEQQRGEDVRQGVWGGMWGRGEGCGAVGDAAKSRTLGVWGCEAEGCGVTERGCGAVGDVPWGRIWDGKGR